MRKRDLGMKAAIKNYPDNVHIQAVICSGSIAKATDGHARSSYPTPTVYTSRNASFTASLYVSAMARSPTSGIAWGRVALPPFSSRART